MSNLDLARFIASLIWQAAHMVIWFMRGNFERGNSHSEEFQKLVGMLDDFEKVGE